jgi:hypothetical protein
MRRRCSRRFLKSIWRGNTLAKSNAGETKLATTLMPSVATREGHGREQREQPAVELGRDLLGVQQHLAVDLEARRWS